MRKLFLILLAFVWSSALFAQDRFVALSFDDGPNTDTTVKMLDVLKKHGVKASFFVVGNHINPESAKVMRRAHTEGHDIENHSRTHSKMTTLSDDSIRNEIEYTSALVEKFVGERPQFFRPPYIDVDSRMYDVIDLPFICGEACEDWDSQVSAKQRVDRMLASARDGLIFLLHDFEGNYNTVEAVDQIIPLLKEQGYEFVTVRELFKRKGISPSKGTLYTDLSNITTPRKRVFLETTEGNILLEMYNETPLHRDNFIKKVNEGVYNGRTFNRVIAGFVVQCGEEQEEDIIPAEIRYPQFFHRRGVLAMGRCTADPTHELKSADEQFYISWGFQNDERTMHRADSLMNAWSYGRVKMDDAVSEYYRTNPGLPSLDGSYTIFGEVVEGLDIIERIQATKTDKTDRPLKDITIKEATVLTEQ